MKRSRLENKFYKDTTVENSKVLKNQKITVTDFMSAKGNYFLIYEWK